MYKKVLFIITACLLLFALLSTAQAYTSDNVKDFLDYLTAEEVSDIQSRIDNIAANRGLDIAIVITDDTKGKTPMAYADDYYDYEGFGIGYDYSGLLLLISINTRDVWISTSGKAVSIFTDSRADNILNTISPYLTDSKYYEGCIEFLNQVDYYAALGAPGGSGSGTGRGSYFRNAFLIMKSPVVYLLAAVIALTATLIISSASRGRVTITNRTYEDSGSFELTSSRDHYLRETTSRVRINSSSSGSRGSSVHRSSSRTHGGRGRKF